MILSVWDDGTAALIWQAAWAVLIVPAAHLLPAAAFFFHPALAFAAVVEAVVTAVHTATAEVPGARGRAFGRTPAAGHARGGHRRHAPSRTTPRRTTPRRTTASGQAATSGQATATGRAAAAWAARAGWLVDCRQGRRPGQGCRAGARTGSLRQRGMCGAQREAPGQAECMAEPDARS